MEIDLQTHDGRAYCMLTYFDPATRDEWRQKVSDFMADWETYLDDPTIHDQAAMVEPGCNMAVLQR